MVTLSGRLFGLGAGVKDTCCSKKELHHRIAGTGLYRFARLLVLAVDSTNRSIEQNPMTRSFPQIAGGGEWGNLASAHHPVDVACSETTERGGACP